MVCFLMGGVVSSSGLQPFWFYEEVTPPDSFTHLLRVSPVIPSRSNRKEPHTYDKYLYRERHLVECLIGKMKHYRRIFSRFDKLADRYMSFLQFVGSMIWLK